MQRPRRASLYVFLVLSAFLAASHCFILLKAPLHRSSVRRRSTPEENEDSTEWASSLWGEEGDDSQKWSAFESSDSGLPSAADGDPDLDTSESFLDTITSLQSMEVEEIEADQEASIKVRILMRSAKKTSPVHALTPSLATGYGNARGGCAREGRRGSHREDLDLERGGGESICECM